VAAYAVLFAPRHDVVFVVVDVAMIVNFRPPPLLGAEAPMIGV
jgi:hypothetical protein